MAATTASAEEGGKGRTCGTLCDAASTDSRKRENNWEQPGPAAFDFRSDIMTTPTARMLDAIAAATLLDDDFRQDPTTLGLESWVAELTGKEAGLFVVSGTMGNLLSVRTHLQGPPHSVMCDHRSHMVTHEAGGVASLCGAMVQTVEPANGRYLTLEDLARKLNRGALVTDCPTRLISLECPLGGVVMPLSECRRISSWAREHGVLMHLDGARLWEAVAAGAGSLEEYCACFDSISLCFSKGLGAPIGSIVVGSQAFRERARWLRKSIGGGMRQAGVVCSAARVAVEDTFLGRKLEGAHARARQIARVWEGHGGRLLYPVETNMVWLDVDAAGMSEQEFVDKGEAFGLKLMGRRLVVHYQIGEEAIRRLEDLFRSCLVWTE
ncbi:alanine racemase [Metarhizium album ARSEF 1941]|uniref:Alanine racemase n=1 Tax=Metarhizium album (strain ARSEF 1941) TaxID=1081103 RepID=A0A0B2WU79_METAS|nr:alanine racemase [Metarhizium album ARSEF 1941]KHN97623.1 alanine racemase [Metarhizium album ARSEF 1941]